MNENPIAWQHATLRDLFAAAALQGIVAGADRVTYSGDGGSAPDTAAQSAAKDAYNYADAMLAERRQRGET